MKKNIIFYLLMLNSINVLGQYQIVGKVIDNDTQEPIEYATVELFNGLSKELLNGTITDADGHFSLNKLKVGKYSIVYSFLGYERSDTVPISLSASSPIADLGILKLHEETQQLEDVVVTARQSTYLNKIDKKVFNVGNDLMSSTSSVGDLMQNIPSVQVDIDGNVSLRGSESVQILIDGRTSTLMGSSRASILQQIPANTIERIEVITNPSARYKPDGTSGIINIVTKKNKNQGIYGTLSGNVGNYERYNATTSLNYNTKKLNFMLSYGLRNDDKTRNTYDIRTRIHDEDITKNTTTVQEALRKAHPRAHLLQGGLGWNINSNSRFELTGSYADIRYSKVEPVTNLITDYTGKTISEYLRNRNNTELKNNAEVSASYEYLFENNDALNVNFKRSYAKEKEENIYNETYTMPEVDPSSDKTNITQHDYENELTINYNRHINDNSILDFGMEIMFNQTNLEYIANDWTNEKWIENAKLTNDFKANDNIYTAYATYETKIDKFGVMGGLRGEISHVKSNLITLDERVTNRYVNLFPTLHTSYHFNDNNELQLNYSLRINRPSCDDLNPFPEYKDPYNMKSGNPNLKPEKTHSIEAGYSFRKNAFSFTTSIYNRYTFDKMTSISQYTELNGTEVLMTSKQNMSSSNATGLELILGQSISNIASINLSTNIFRHTIDASELEYGDKRSAYSWYISLNSNFTITKNLMLQANAKYNGKGINPQGYTKPSWYMNTGLRYDILKNKISILATVSDIFNSNVLIKVVDTPEIKQRNEVRRTSRIIYGGFVYNFGNSPKKPKAATLKYEEAL